MTTIILFDIILIRLTQFCIKRSPLYSGEARLLYLRASNFLFSLKFRLFVLLLKEQESMHMTSIVHSKVWTFGLSPLPY
jgi:hypothetical protein